MPEGALKLKSQKGSRPLTALDMKGSLRLSLRGWVGFSNSHERQHKEKELTERDLIAHL